MQLLEAVLEITFFQSFGGKSGCNWVVKFLRSLKGYLRFLDFKKSYYKIIIEKADACA